MRAGQCGTLLLTSVTLVGCVTRPAVAQVFPWDVFSDSPVSASVCDLVNAENVELVVLSETGQLVLVTGPDVTLVDTFVNVDGDVFFGNDPVGFIGFAEDGDGFRTLWWMSLTGTVVHVDYFTGEPTATDLLPTDFVDVPCDACDFWDDPTVCAEPIDPDEPDRPIIFNFCGLGAPTAVAMTAFGLLAMGLTRRRFG